MNIEPYGFWFGIRLPFYRSVITRKELNVFYSKYFSSNSIPFSFKIRIYSSRKLSDLWCFCWFITYFITESFSFSDKVNAPYPSAQNENKGYVFCSLIHTEEDTFISFIKSANATDGCKSHTI